MRPRPDYERATTPRATATAPAWRAASRWTTSKLPAAARPSTASRTASPASCSRWTKWRILLLTVYLCLFLWQWIQARTWLVSAHFLGAHVVPEQVLTTRAAAAGEKGLQWRHCGCLWRRGETIFYCSRYSSQNDLLTLSISPTKRTSVKCLTFHHRASERSFSPTRSWTPTISHLWV